MNKKILAILAICILIIVIIGIVVFLNVKSNQNLVSTDNEENQNLSNKEENTSNKESDKGEDNMYKTGKHHATMVIKDYGTIKLELDADVAPITVANFAKLVNEGFYNRLTFHRIISGFMIQGGDPQGTGMGGSDEEIKGEFEANGVKNNISHKRGTISMARAQSYNSASSQFFIVHEDSEFLDKQYAGFGVVTEGMEVVDKICENTEVEDDNGTVLKQNQPIIEKITMED